MKKSYNGAGFSTTGNWIIPFVLGWSKSTVSMGLQPIGIMYTIHIIPYFNIGVNNPKPKYKPYQSKPVEPMSKCDCMDDCDCGGCCHDEDNNNGLPDETYIKAEDFVFSSDPEKVFAVVPYFDESGKPELLILVASEDVEIPDQFDGIPTIKEVTTCPETCTENETE